ncbi:very short patch repair endonuclease [Tistrella mobilis]|uniref:very short patch repair endonuclease n=1 Tax=Tistrella mobilis TaxID=171437 RepID=UPI003557CE85
MKEQHVTIKSDDEPLPDPSFSAEMGDRKAVVPTRQHRGDFMSPDTRSAVMSRIRGSNTGPERKVQAILEDLGLNFESHVRTLPGRPDFVLRQHSLCIFVDGDFWHGWRFDTWRLKLSEKWEAKIAATRRRDQYNRRLLRQAGWQVLRIWEHQVRESPYRCRRSILLRVERGLPFGDKLGNIAAQEAKRRKMQGDT